MFIDESIFKNKLYGTYVLRKKYYKFTIISFFISALFVLLIFSLPLIIQFSRQVNIEHTRLRPTQVPMELLDIPLDALMEEKEQLAEQKNDTHVETLPEQSDESDATLPVVNDTIIDTSGSASDTAYNKNNKQEEEGIFECGSNLLNFRMWFIQNFQFPVNEKIRKTEGRAIAIFIVNEKGYVDSVDIISGIDPYIDSAIKRTLLNSPRWKPCRIGGKAVKQLYHFPVYLVRKI